MKESLRESNGSTRGLRLSSFRLPPSSLHFWPRAGPRPERPPAAANLELTLDDVENLVLVVVDVRRRPVLRRERVFNDRVDAPCLLAPHLARHLRPEHVPLCPAARRDDNRFSHAGLHRFRFAP